MEAARGILVALATVFIAAECSVPFFKRNDIPEPRPHGLQSCLTPISDCARSFQQNPRIRSVTHDPRILIDHIDEICGLIQEAVDCIRPSVDECDDHSRQEVDAVLSVADFVCGNRSRSLLREVQVTTCYTNYRTLRSFLSSTDICYREAYLDMRGSPCQSFTHMRNCLTQVTTQQCGEAAGEFASEIFHRLATGFYHSCSNDSPQESLKRTLLG